MPSDFTTLLRRTKPRTRDALVLTLAAFVALSAAACSDEENKAEESLASQIGITEYLGTTTPASVREQSDGSIAYRYDAEDGPMCMRGDYFRASRRDGESDNLLIFLQGGGACWSEFCLAVTAAPEGVPASADILNPGLEVNPVRDWDVVYVPYCDGSMFAGDMDHTDETPARYHRGLQNLSAALDIAAEHYPNPPRVMLGGSSAGAYGSLLGVMLVRHIYPDAEILLVNDSGPGLGLDGDDNFLATLLDEFNIARFIPGDCEDCLDNGHIIGLLGWIMDRDPNLKVSFFASWYDGVIANIFLKIPPADYRDSLRRETDRMQQRFPQRFRRFIVDGAVHTTLLGDPSGIIGSDLGSVELPDGFFDDLGNVQLGSMETTAIGDLLFADWLQAMVDGDESVWVDTLEAAGDPPESAE